MTDRAEGQGKAGADAPVLDLDHLERQCMGNADLAREVLSLFLAQSQSLAAAIVSDPQHRAERAHKLVGSARGIGAVQVAESASAIERAALAGGGDAVAPALLDTLAARVAEVRTVIARELDGAGTR